MTSPNEKLKQEIEQHERFLNRASIISVFLTMFFLGISIAAVMDLYQILTSLFG